MFSLYKLAQMGFQYKHEIKFTNNVLLTCIESWSLEAVNRILHFRMTGF